MSYNNTAIAPDGKRYATGSPELSEPFDEPDVVRAIGEIAEGAVPTGNDEGVAEWKVPEGGGGGVSVESATAWLQVSYDFSEVGNHFAADDGTSPWPAVFHRPNVVQWDGTDVTPEGDFTFDGLEWDDTAKTLTVVDAAAYIMTTATSVSFDGTVTAGYRADVSHGHPSMSLVALPGTTSGQLITVSSAFVFMRGSTEAPIGVYIGPSDFENPGVDVVGGNVLLTFTKIAG